MSEYETDILAWSDRQALLLRRLAAGEAPNERPDWLNIIEEVESAGRSELPRVRSLLIQALAQDLKCECWPFSRHVPHWRAEARGFREDAADSFAPSMRRHLDAAQLYAKALRRLPETLDGQPPLPVRAECPVTLDELLGQA